ncbi:MAG: hypothetical protein COB04_18545 [Gammaproteobacteria bacterium]|nr:MAG: hypothetical protein COB04_18545 [Gammaproteobacteria bacterium]
MRKLFTGCLLAVSLSIVSLAHAGDRNIVVTLSGVGSPIDVTTLPLFERLPDGVQANILSANVCFEVPMFNLTTNRLIGRGIDCLGNFDFTDELIPELTLTDTVIFQFHSGTIVATSEVTIQQNLTGDPNVTHLTGAFPSEENIDFTSGRFRRSDGGTVRLSGGVDMSDFIATGGPLVFNCIFVIDLN